MLRSMNAENFTEYIENPSLLLQMNYEELKQLILQYPYNANLRYLLAKKSQLEGRSDHERNLRNAAIHGPDRKKLFQLLKEETDPEERLELKQLSELELAAKEEILEEIVLDIDKSPASTTFNTTDIEDALDREDFSFPTPFDGELDESSDEKLSSEQSEEVNKTVEPTPLHRSQFKSWHQRYQQPQKITLPDKDEKVLLEKLPNENVLESSDVASETLAELLTHQHQNEKAIEVYERLALLFPEKSDFFAEQIESLKNK